MSDIHQNYKTPSWIYIALVFKTDISLSGANELRLDREYTSNVENVDQ